MNQFFKSVVVIVASLALVSCDTPVTDCENDVSLPLQIQINDCVESPCELERGSTVVMNVTFRAPHYVEGLTPEVIATALGVNVTYPLSETNGCNSLLNIRCPIDAEEIIRYQLQMPILAFYPTISLQIKFTIYDENSNGLMCFVVAARVVLAS
ncbi:niemann pick type c2 protein npc2-related [Holotrichia oblita]|uniref:Niemann pick type c2 protein npc2-related n=1 Tax=Holotrichia oblita TaxID=644536 RepID=A0ACB9TXX4_HOLOL|nr:niemann pick type c2 protein npc2-related [Holotrichia oblita]